MMEDKTKKIYKPRNWKEYNQSLVNRGKLTFWMNEKVLENWNVPKSKKKGRPFFYSSIAIEASLTIRYAINLSLRGIEGFIHSLFSLMHIKLPVPDYTLLSKRGKNLPKPKFPDKITDIVIDSNGLKVYGEGEWKVRQYGADKRRKWKKLHIGIDPKTGKVQIHEITDSNISDTEVGCQLIKRLKKVKKVYGDGGYDTEHFIKEVLEKGGMPIIPPRKGAVIRKEPTLKSRNSSILEITGLGGNEEGLQLWKKLKKYHTRSLVESWFSRYKRLLTGSLRSRKMKTQEAEIGYKINIMNVMTDVGMPFTYPC